MDSIMNIIIALFGGGVIGAIVNAMIQKNKINAEANNTNVKSLLEIDQRMHERMTKLEERVANLETENYKLKTEKLSLEEETRKLKERIIDLENENKALHEENLDLKQILESYIDSKQEKEVE